MSLYTIAQLAQLSGVKAHTIRIWEKRFHLLVPERTETNIRRYNDMHLRKLLNAVTLLNSGVKISKIAALTEKELNEFIDNKMKEESTADFTAEAILSQLFTAGLTYNEVDFEKAFSSAILKFGVKQTYKKIIYPLLVRAGYMWQSTRLTPSQEHFITNLVKRKLFTAIDAFPAPVKSGKRWILFLPENEFHEIGLLFAYYLIRSSGMSAVYLGPSIPIRDIVGTAQVFNPTDLLCFSVQRIQKNVLQKYVRQLGNAFENANIVLSAERDRLNGIKTPKNLNLISSVEEFEKLL